MHGRSQQHCRMEVGMKQQEVGMKQQDADLRKYTQCLEILKDKNLSVDRRNRLEKYIEKYEETML
jgi:hypothetical protein